MGVNDPSKDEWRRNVLLLKIGGGDSINLAGIAHDLADFGDSVCVVHGANALRDDLAGRLGVEKQVLTSVSGYTSVYTDKQLMDVMLMAYSGLRNKRLVELLQMNGVNAVGLTGLDGALVRGKRNQGIRVRQGGKTLIKRDLSGKPVEVNRKLLGLLLDSGFTPVVTMPLIDENNVAVNSENDDVVAVLNQVLEADVVVQLIEAPGILEDHEDPGSVIPRIPRAELAEREKRVHGRMRRKLLALRRLTERASTRVVVADGRRENPLADALAGRGTVIL